MRVRRSFTGARPGSAPLSDPAPGPAQAPARAAGHWEPSLLRRLLRRPVVSWGVAGGLALAAGTIVADTTADATRLRDSYGTTRQVLVTEAEVTSGGLLAPSVVLRSLPIAAIPDDAVEAIDPAATAVAPISAGAVLTLQDLAGTEGLRPDEAAVAVPVGPAVPSTGPGTAVWVVVAADPFAGLDAAVVPGRVLAASEEAVTVVVAVSDLATVSAASGAGVAGLALRGE